MLVAFGGQTTQQKDREESTGISATLRFEVGEEMRAGRKQPTKPGLENVLAELLLKEAHGERTCCRCLRVCFHLFSSICLRLSHVDGVFAWPVNPLLFLFSRFLNVINWGLCFPSMRLERRQVLACPHLHIHRTLWGFFLLPVSFGFVFLSLPPLPHLFG